MRLYTQEMLKNKPKAELQFMLDRVKVNSDLTLQEKEANIEILTIALNGGTRLAKKDLLKEIEAGMPDYSDIV